MAKRSRNENGNGNNDAVKIALIGAAATVLVAIISGIFARLERMPDPTPTAVAVVLATVASTATPISPPTDTPVPTATPQPADTATPTPITPRPLLFASQIAPDGRALDAGASFAADVHDIYAVFQPGQTPPGITIAAENPDPQAYYAFLQPTGRPALQTIGWRWIKDDQVVNEYSGEASGEIIWLQSFDPNGGPLFNLLGGPGRYRVVLLLDGNPSLSTALEIVVTGE